MFRDAARKDLKGFPDGGFEIENALSAEEALRSITIWAAKANFMEKTKGSIEVGKDADFVILDQDIMQIPITKVPEVQVVKTFILGKEVFVNKK